MVKPRIIRERITKDELADIAKNGFGIMAKVAVDVERGILAVGGEWHSEGDEMLVQDGSSRLHVWGANIYPFNSPEDRIEYISLINIKPQCDNRSMDIEDAETRLKVKAVINNLLLPDNESL